MIRALGVLVVYDPIFGERAEKEFRNLMSSCFDLGDVQVVSNNSAFQCGNIIGSNDCAEFTGWDEGLSHCAIQDYHVIVLANDTFCNRHRFGAQEAEAFKSALVESLDRHERFLVGEVCWAVDYSALRRGRRFLLRWVRTSIFALSLKALDECGKIGICGRQLDNDIRLDASGLISYGSRVSPLVRNRIDRWLFPQSPEEGWYKAAHANTARILLKAKCVLQELQLTARCENAGIHIIPVNKGKFIRSSLFELAYRLQRLLPK